jgi:hypothetical protein
MATQSATPVRTPARQTLSRQTPTRQTPSSTRAKRKDSTKAKPFQMPFDRKNITIILAGVAVIVLGYIVMYVSPTMSDMALTVSPILLVLGYCVIVPFGIMAGVRSKRTAVQPSEPTSNGSI